MKAMICARLATLCLKKDSRVSIGLCRTRVSFPLRELALSCRTKYECCRASTRMQREPRTLPPFAVHPVRWFARALSFLFLRQQSLAWL